MLIRPPFVVILLAGFVSAFAGCPRREAQPEEPREPGFTLVFSAGVAGHLEPCGCSPDMRGGLDRAAEAIRSIRAEGRPVLLVDGGDRFFPGPLSEDPLTAGQQIIQADSVAEITKLMNYEVVALGARDTAGGPEFFSGKPLPRLLDGSAEPVQGTVPGLVREIDGTRVGLLALGPQGDEALAQRAAALREDGAQVLLLIAYRTFEEARELLPTAKEAGIHFVLASRAEVPETHESAALATDPPLFTVAARGEALLRIDIVPQGEPGAPFTAIAGAEQRAAEIEAIDQRISLMREQVRQMRPADPNRRLRTEKLLELEERKARLANAPPPSFPTNANAFAHAFVPMTPNLEGEPEVRAAIERFDLQVGERNLAHAKAHPTPCPAPGEGQAQFVGDETCRGCHVNAFAFWQDTPHARAYETLEKMNKQYNVACISCHVTGWGQPGGTCSIALTEGRQGVQCENCHGPGSLHAQTADPSKIRREVEASTCVRCHDAENSPHFNYEAYRPQILGPGHGLPMPQTP